MVPKDNEARLAAISSPLEPMVLEAGAGSGKTETMVRRLVTAVEQGTDLANIVAVTFTRKAAGELRERLQHRLAASESPVAQAAAARISEAKIGTIDSLVQWVIAQHGLAQGHPTAIRVMEDSELDALIGKELAVQIPAWLDDSTLAESWRALAQVHPRVDRQFELLQSVASVAAKNPEAEIVDITFEDFCSNWVSDGLGAIETMRLPDKLDAVVTPWIASTRGLLDEGLYEKITFPRMGVLGGNDAKASRHEIKDICERFSLHWRYPILLPLIQRAIQSGRATEFRFRQKGQMVFDSALRIARDLLDDPAVAAELAKDVKVLTVDEMQDTSPDQLQFLLKFGNLGASVFTVGDPKQAIYRFRGADVAGYQQFRETARSRNIPVRHLSANFRSVPAVLEMVEAVAESHLGWPDGAQMDHHRSDTEDDCAFLFGGYTAPTQNYAAEEAREAAILAILFHHFRNWRDIAILIRARTNLPLLQESLEKFCVPYRFENLVSVSESPEIRAIASILALSVSKPEEVRFHRAEALRSAAFAVPESELLESLRAYESLDAILLSISDLAALPAVERIIESCGFDSSAAFARRPSAIWNRLAWLRSRARSLLQEGKPEIADLLESISKGANSDRAESPAPEPDEDAVRVMTVHASKGLQFPAVITLGFGSHRSRSMSSVAVDNGQILFRFAAGATSPGYKDAASQHKVEEKNERDRLLYVAMTRAEDQLAVSAWRKGLKEPKPEDLAGGMAHLTQEIDPCDPHISAETPFAFIPDDGGREKLAATDMREPRTTPTQLAKSADEESEIDDRINEDYVFVASKSSTAMGLALHQFMETVSLTHWSFEPTISPVLDPKELESLAKNAWQSTPVRRASKSPKVLRESYFGALHDGLVMEGVLDLVFQNEDGTIEVADYKTDRVTSESQAKKKMENGYRRQGHAYADLVEAALGKRPAHAWFIFVRANPPVLIDALA